MSSTLSRPTVPRSSRRILSVAFSALLPIVLIAGCAKSCQKTSGAAAARDDLALVPKEADIVFMINLTRARSSVLWKKLLEFRDKDPAAKKQYDEFVQKCQMDPLAQLDSAFLALPQDSGQSREFALLGRGKLEEAKLVACVRINAKDNGKEVEDTLYQGHHLYTISGQEGSFTVLGKNLAVLAGKEWIKKIIDQYDNRVPGNGAKDHAALMDLVKRTQQGDAMWGAGIVPPAVAEKLKTNPQLGAAASMKSVFGSIDFAKGVTIHLNMDLGSEQDAAELTVRVKDQLESARKEPKVQLMGLASYFSAIKVEAKKNTFVSTIELNQEQVDDLSMRLSGLAKSFGLGRPDVQQ